MIGIRIYGRASFAEIFSPILSKVDGLTWVITGGQPWRFPEEWEDASDFDPETSLYTSGPLAEFQRDVRQLRDGAADYGYVAAMDLFPKYAPAVNDFGDSIYGLRLTPEEAVNWFKNSYWSNSARDDHLDLAVRAAEVSFVGNESWWEFYSKDESHFSLLRAHLLPTTAWKEGAVSPIEAGYEECSSESSGP